MDVVVICKFDKQFPKNALLSCTQTIEVACVVLVSNLSEHREAAPSRPCERKEAEPAVALFCLRLNPALRIEFVDDFGNCTTSQSQGYLPTRRAKSVRGREARAGAPIPRQKSASR